MRKGRFHEVVALYLAHVRARFVRADPSFAPSGPPRFLFSRGYRSGRRQVEAVFCTCPIQRRYSCQVSVATTGSRNTKPTRQACSPPETQCSAIAALHSPLLAVCLAVGPCQNSTRYRFALRTICGALGGSRIRHGAGASGSPARPIPERGCSAESIRRELPCAKTPGKHGRTSLKPLFKKKTPKSSAV